MFSRQVSHLTIIINLRILSDEVSLFESESIFARSLRNMTLLTFPFSWCQYFPSDHTECDVCQKKHSIRRVLIWTSVLQDIDRLDHYGQLTGLKASQDVTYDSQVSLSLVMLSYLQGLSLVRASTT